MKTVVAYYSLGGTCRKFAEARAKTLGAPLIAVEEARKRNRLSAFFVGCPKAMNQKPSAVKPISEKITGCDRLAIFAPVWAGMPAPAFNSLVNALHKGQEVEVTLVSASGASKAEAKVRAQLEAKGVKLISFADVKKPAKIKEPKK
jgi:NAD(P)H-dependent FMN reductase